MKKMFVFYKEMFKEMNKTERRKSVCAIVAGLLIACAAFKFVLDVSTVIAVLAACMAVFSVLGYLYIFTEN